MIGRQYEHAARCFLEQAGLRFIAANVHIGKGELDLIMRDQHTWVFVEVRYRKNADFGGALLSISVDKRKRLLVTAHLWLAKQGASFTTTDCRFDVMAITHNQWEWIVDAFND